MMQTAHQEKPAAPWMKRRGARLMTLLAAVFIGLFLWWRLTPPVPPPLEVSLWYWHQPFKLTAPEIAQMQSLGIQSLFVRAGTFHKEGRGVRPTLPQKWAGRAEQMSVHLVFHFDYDVVRNFTRMDRNAIAAAVQEAAQSQRAQAERIGLQVIGIQMDLDCPTQRLPEYALLLQQIRAALHPAFPALSITALPTWYGSRNISAVLQAVDFAVPQYYEPEIGKTRETYAPVSRLRMAERGMRAAGRQGTPFYVGIPAYGHALLYDEKGRLLGAFHDMGIRETFHHPAFKLTRSFPADKDGKPAATTAAYIGEDLYDFEAVQDADNGKGKGYHLLYDLPTPALVAQHLALVRAERPANCLGVILFRYPEPQERETLPLPSLQAALRGESLQPSLRIQIKTTPAPWELIETGRHVDRAPLDVTVTVTNIGTASTFLAPDAVTVTLGFDQPGLEDIALRDFESKETFYTADPAVPSTPSTLLRAGSARANLVQFRLSYLAAGDTAVLGPLRIPANGATKVWGRWSALAPGKWEVLHGETGPIELISLPKTSGHK